MKILKLEIHNIASIGNAEIDFTAFPLSDADVFLITGETGSGKTTILDCICLALYNQVPRMSSTSMNGSEEGTNPTDPRQFLRHGAGEGFTALTFIAEDGKEYKAVWEVRRAHNKPGGKLQESIHSLKGPGFTARNKTEVRNIIPTLTGLTYSQFCRTVMLPQGEFTRFLKSSDKEKAELLERIIGQDIYRRIGRKIFELTSEAKDKVARLKEECEFFKPMGDEELAQAKNAVKALSEEVKVLTERSKKIDRILQWMISRTKLSADLEIKRSESTSAEAALNTPDILQLKEELSIWNESTVARALISEISEIEKKCKAQNTSLQNKRKDYAVALGYKISLTERLRNLGCEMEKLTSSIAEAEGMAENASEADGILVSIQGESTHIVRLCKSIQSYKKSIEDYQKEIAPVQTQMDTIKSSLPENFDIRVLTDEKTQADTYLSALKDLSAGIKSAEESGNEVKKLRDRLDSLKTETAALKEDIEKTRSEIPMSREKLSRAENLYNLAKEAHGLQAQHMRTLLTPGCHCPVCRQTVSVIPEQDNDAAAVLLESLKKEYEQARDALLELESKLSSDSAKLKNSESELVTESELYKAKNDNFQCEQKKITEALNVYSLTADKLPEYILKAEQVAHEKARLVNLAADYLKLQTSSAKISSNLTEAQASLKTCEANLSELKNARHHHAEELKKMKVPVQWVPEKPSDVEKCRNNIADFLNNLKVLRLKKEETARILDQNRNILNLTISDLEKIVKVIPQWADVEPVDFRGNKPDTSSLATETVACTGLIKLYNAEVKDRQEELSAILQNTDYSEEKLKGLLIKGENFFRAASVRINSLTLALERANALTLQAEKSLEIHLKDAPQEAAEASLAELNDQLKTVTEQINAKNIELGAINQKLKDDKDKRLSRQSKLEELTQAQKVFTQWSRLDKISDREGSRFVRIAQSYVLESLIRGANRYLEQLTDRYTLHLTPGTYNINIRDRYCGGKERSANTGSGGESFMVSLSLALALSDLNGLAPSDTLFIDEGFGTLSSEPLEAAVSLLERLNTFSGRRVGVISHIEELRRRIPVQISVTRNPATAQSTVQAIHL